MGDELVRLLKAVIDVHGLKEVAYALGANNTFLSHAAAGRDSKYLRVNWVPWLVALAATDEPVAFLADIREKVLAEKRPATVAQQLTNLKAAMHVHLSEMSREDIVYTARMIHKRGEDAAISIIRELRQARRPAHRHTQPQPSPSKKAETK